MQVFVIGVIAVVLLLVMVYLYVVSVIVDNMYDKCDMCHRSLKYIDWIYEPNKNGNVKICIECIKRMR